MTNDGEDWNGLLYGHVGNPTVMVWLCWISLEKLQEPIGKWGWLTMARIKIDYNVDKMIMTRLAFQVQLVFFWNLAYFLSLSTFISRFYFINWLNSFEQISRHLWSFVNSLLLAEHSADTFPHEKYSYKTQCKLNFPLPAKKAPPLIYNHQPFWYVKFSSFGVFSNFQWRNKKRKHVQEHRNTKICLQLLAGHGSTQTVPTSWWHLRQKRPYVRDEMDNMSHNLFYVL